MDIADYRVGDSDDLFLVYQFISTSEAASFLDTICSAQQKWKQVNGRCVREYGGTITRKGHIACKLPSWLHQLSEKVDKLLGTEFFKHAPQHVLMNVYQPGDGIMPHEDGPKYEPIVAILSLGAPAVFRFFEKPCPSREGGNTSPGKPVLSLLLPSKSLLVFRGKYYSQYLHGIDAVHQEVVDSTVVNRRLFPSQGGVGDDEGLENSAETDEQHRTLAEDADSWTFPRGGTRVSLTMRNGFQKIASVQL